MLFEKKLKIGDDIELPSGHHGKVIEIHVQNTVVKTKDGQRIIVPERRPDQPYPGQLD